MDFLSFVSDICSVAGFILTFVVVPCVQFLIRKHKRNDEPSVPADDSSVVCDVNSHK